MSIAYEILKRPEKPIICVVDSALEADKLKQELLFFCHGLKKKIAYFSDYEVGFQNPLSPANTIVSQRLKILNQLLHQQLDILIVTKQTLFTQLPPTSFVKQHVFQFKKGQKVKLSTLKDTFVQSGYHRMNNVSTHQEFSLRGSIIDFFPAHSKHPIRIELDDDIIDNIHYFDIATQRSNDSELDQIDITPSYEFETNGASETGWHRHLDQYHENLDSLLDYAPSHALFASKDFDAEADDIPKNMILPLKTREKIIRKIDLLAHSIEAKDEIELSLDKKDFEVEIKKLKAKKNLLFVCQSYFRLNQLEALLLSHNIKFTHVKHFHDFASKNIDLGICLGKLPHILKLEKSIVVPEHTITKKVIVKAEKAPSITVDHLNVGDLMIHSDHGIGRFIGIETHTINNLIQDFVVIQYAKNDRLMFPPDQLHKIHPYQGDLQDLDELRSSRWKKRKKKALENIELFATKLLQLQSQRIKSSLPPISLPSEYEDFINDFPFSETPDQLSIMEKIIQDYQKNALFNRLVCGDVGFGKTEIAMRSAFIALMNGYQVALITPTTILATQHYNNFKARFEKWNIRIALLSRSNQNADKESEKIKNGDIQLVIGTHKLLSQQFSNLALVIVDEEHRFGVKQKDSIEVFNKAHKLSLTATPIPRSLNMALSKLRDISIMSQPPKSRLPIHTTIEVEDDQLVKQALDREIHRGGQAYIIYNNVKSIDAFHKKMASLCPHLQFGVVHGQMPVLAIEKQMARFHAQGFQVLIASTIIESGLDIPNANTVIVYRSDKLGLAQLHQIRGRVGRSHHQAYAYLLRPETITKKAEMRLAAISKAMKLGAGFQLSVADLEIRGAGNLLGQEQSGHVNAIGLSYYTHLLNQATQSEKNLKVSEINIETVKIIPKDYISDTESRYKIYHRLANCHLLSELQEIHDELSERYGPIPTETKNLIEIAKIRIEASSLGIQSIQSQKGSLLIDLGEKTTLDVDHILTLIQKEPSYSLGGSHHIKVVTEDPILSCQILLNRLSLQPGHQHS